MTSPGADLPGEFRTFGGATSRGSTVHQPPVSQRSRQGTSTACAGRDQQKGGLPGAADQYRRHAVASSAGDDPMTSLHWSVPASAGSKSPPCRDNGVQVRALPEATSPTSRPSRPRWRWRRCIGTGKAAATTLPARTCLTPTDTPGEARGFSDLRNGLPSG